jgi:hypothetical protein
MNTSFDTIIWGPSLNGIIKAIELKNTGKNVLLAGKFGFPGGKASESLASLFSVEFFSQHALLSDFLKQVESIKYGILFRNQQWILIHPEAVKRVCWQMINDHNLEVLFHIIPLHIKKGEKSFMEVFGREGKFTIHAGDILDMSDDQYLDNLAKQNGSKSMVINSFFSDPLPADLPGFKVLRRFETPIGQYISISIKNVAYGEVEQTFNRELDRLSKESWKKYQARILMVPVYPEMSS